MSNIGTKNYDMFTFEQTIATKMNKIKITIIIIKYMILTVHMDQLLNFFHQVLN